MKWLESLAEALWEAREEGRAEERKTCAHMLRNAAADLPESYKRSKKKIIEVADAIAAKDKAS